MSQLKYCFELVLDTKCVKRSKDAVKAYRGIRTASIFGKKTSVFGCLIWVHMRVLGDILLRLLPNEKDIPTL